MLTSVIIAGVEEVVQAVDTDFRAIGNVAVIVSVGVIEVGETIRSSRPEVFLGKGVLKICSKFTGEHL